MCAVRIWVCRGRRGYQVWVEAPEGRDFQRGTRRSAGEALRLAGKEAAWWRSHGYPVRFEKRGSTPCPAGGVRWA